MSVSNADLTPQRRNIRRWVFIFLGAALAVIVGMLFLRPGNSLKRDVEEAGGIYLEYRVDLRRNPLWQAIPEYVANALIPGERRWFAISFSDTDLHDDWLREHATQLNQRKIASLDIAQTQVTDDGIRQLQPSSSIVFLDIAGTAVTDDSIPTILRLGNLYAVDLADTSVTSQGVMQLTQHPRLQTVVFNGDLLTDEVVEQFNQAPRLIELTLQHVSPSQLELAGKLQHVKHLTVQGVSEETLLSLDGFPHLTRLTVLGSEISKESLASLRNRNPNMGVVHSELSEEEMRELGAHQNLEQQSQVRWILAAISLFTLAIISLAIALRWRRRQKMVKIQESASRFEGDSVNRTMRSD